MNYHTEDSSKFLQAVRYVQHCRKYISSSSFYTSASNTGLLLLHTATLLWLLHIPHTRLLLLLNRSISSCRQTYSYQRSIEYMDCFWPTAISLVLRNSKGLQLYEMYLCPRFILLVSLNIICLLLYSILYRAFELG